ncbi:hypothetical protein F4679DRAFT_587778 [Xylaria curta]|nr:hypothetical protein F4679DRAFT_587778 [Xylaria curta]
MKYLLAPALLATAAHALGLVYKNEPAPLSTFTIGTDYVLQWTPYDAQPTDTFTLKVVATNKTETRDVYGFPHFDMRTVVVGDAVKFVNGVYTWKVEPIDDKGVWKGEEFYYSFNADYQSHIASSRTFQIVD